MWTLNKASTYAQEFNEKLQDEDLRMLCLVMQITDIALRPTLSSHQIAMLRQMIKELQEICYRTRSNFHKCVNLHWLVHLPDDIERYGPVYSWWLFGYERMNKTLKGANSNGHFRDTPLIAYNKYMRVTSIEMLGTHDVAEADEMVKNLAQRSEHAFRQALAQTNSTAEEKDAPRLHLGSPLGSHSLDSSQRPETVFFTVEKKEMRPLSNADLDEICLVWNKQPESKTTVRPAVSSYINDPCFSVPAYAQYVLRFSIGRNPFRTPKPKDPVPATGKLSDDHLLRYRGCFVEWRTDNHIYQCMYVRCPVCLIDSVLEVTAEGKADATETRRFIKLHWLKPWRGQDP